MDKAYFPLTFATAIPAMPPDIEATALLEAFRTKVHPNMSLLSYIPIQSYERTELTDYVAYAMATVASLICSTSWQASRPLWSTANMILSLALELDNREARNVDLINAVKTSLLSDALNNVVHILTLKQWVLLLTYGALCAEPRFWERTNITHGYVETVCFGLLPDYCLQTLLLTLS